MEWESDDHLYFTDKCRSCLKPLRKMYNLFEIFDQDLKLSDILKMTTFLEVKEDEGLSQYICEICMNIVVDFYNFINVYLENDKYVRSILEKRLAKNDSETGNEKEHKPVQELSRKGDIKLEFQESTEQYTCLPEEVCVLVVDDKNKDTVPGDHKDGLAKIKEEIIDNKSFRNQKKSSLRSFDRTRIEEYTILPEDECVVVVSGKRKNPEVVNDLTDKNSRIFNLLNTVVYHAMISF
ncbi:hypothetical protein JTB14_004935 [Gonioctena quinquepunctata]|nr:hypothetical protein JTB14_004935 [Gonioctena quinquepunctata]